jgi:two-component system, OmpR family, sensor kinase
MAFNSRSPGFWQSVRQLPGRLPLWGKLIAALLALVTVALIVISVAGIGLLRSYLLDQANGDLYALSSGFHNQAAVQQSIGTGTPLVVPEGSVVYWLPTHGHLQGISETPSQAHGLGLGGGTSGPDIDVNASWLSSGQPTTVSATSGPGHWQVLAVPWVQQSQGASVTGTVIYGWNVTSVYQTTGRLVGVDWIVSLALLVGLAVVGVTVIRASLRPLTDIERTASAIAAGDLTRRVPERDPRTEVGRLGRSLNVMLSQIESAFRAQSQSEAAARRSEERMRQFVADASHELRTPLTAIRGFAEYYRQRGGVTGEPGDVASTPDVDLLNTALNETGQLSPADLTRIMRRVEQESARMGVLVEDMLLLARLDQQRPLDRKTVDLLALAADAVQDARVIAPNRSINLTVGAGAALLVNGDEVRLRQVIGNLMSNALAHTPDGTPVDVHIRSGNLEEIWAATGTAPTTGYSAGAMASEKVAVLEVTDYGPGLTEEQQAHVFERFYRADQARTSEGTGLGLAIVAALVGAHGGAVWVQSEYGNGATFSIALPLAPEALHDEGDVYFPDEDAEVLDWGSGPEYDDAVVPPEAPEPQDRWAAPEATDQPETATPDEARDQPQAGDASGDFHGATAWQGPVSWSNRPSSGGDA